MSATGDHSLVDERIPVLSEANHERSRALCPQVLPCANPINHGDHLLFVIAQVVIAKHNERT